MSCANGRKWPSRPKRADPCHAVFTFLDSPFVPNVYATSRDPAARVGTQALCRAAQGASRRNARASTISCCRLHFFWHVPPVVVAKRGVRREHAALEYRLAEASPTGECSEACLNGAYMRKDAGPLVCRVSVPPMGSTSPPNILDRRRTIPKCHGRLRLIQNVTEPLRRTRRPRTARSPHRSTQRRTRARPDTQRPGSVRRRGRIGDEVAPRARQCNVARFSAVAGRCAQRGSRVRLARCTLWRAYKRPSPSRRRSRWSSRSLGPGSVLGRRTHRSSAPPRIRTVSPSSRVALVFSSPFTNVVARPTRSISTATAVGRTRSCLREMPLPARKPSREGRGRGSPGRCCPKGANLSTSSSPRPMRLRSKGRRKATSPTR
jgi:hypothetical protein